MVNKYMFCYKISSPNIGLAKEKKKNFYSQTLLDTSNKIMMNNYMYFNLENLSFILMLYFNLDFYCDLSI